MNAFSAFRRHPRRFALFGVSAFFGDISAFSATSLTISAFRRLISAFRRHAFRRHLFISFGVSATSDPRNTIRPTIHPPSARASPGTARTTRTAHRVVTSPLYTSHHCVEKREEGEGNSRRRRASWPGTDVARGGATVAARTMRSISSISSVNRMIKSSKKLLVVLSERPIAESTVSCRCTCLGVGTPHSTSIATLCRDSGRMVGSTR